MATNTVGVVIFDDFLKDGFTALMWAKKEFVTKSTRPKLCVILIKKADVAKAPVIQQPLTGDSSRRQSLDKLPKIVEKFFPYGHKEGHQGQERFEKLAGDFEKNIVGEMYEGPSIQETLKSAMQQINGLDTLIVGCAAGAITTEGSKLPNELELSAGCKQIVLVEKIVSRPPSTAPQTDTPAGRERAAPSNPSPPVISFMVIRICATETGLATTRTVFHANELE